MERKASGKPTFKMKSSPAKKIDVSGIGNKLKEGAKKVGKDAASGSGVAGIAAKAMLGPVGSLLLKAATKKGSKEKVAPKVEMNQDFRKSTPKA